MNNPLPDFNDPFAVADAYDLDDVDAQPEESTTTCAAPGGDPLSLFIAKRQREAFFSRKHLDGSGITLTDEQRLDLEDRERRSRHLAIKLNLLSQGFDKFNSTGQDFLSGDMQKARLKSRSTYWESDFEHARVRFMLKRGNQVQVSITRKHSGFFLQPDWYSRVQIVLMRPAISTFQASSLQDLNRCYEAISSVLNKLEDEYAVGKDKPEIYLKRLSRAQRVKLLHDYFSASKSAEHEHRDPFGIIAKVLSTTSGIKRADFPCLY